MSAVVGLGEALFDLLPAGPVLGGAPLNVAVHAQQLGLEGVLVSRIGGDPLGARLRGELAARGLGAEHVQEDAERPTGTVKVTLENGEPRYEIAGDVAWDRLDFNDSLRALAARCDAVCFGTLAQRDPRSRRAIRRFLESAPQAVRLFDVNLRQHYYDAEILRGSFALATMAKLNLAELPVVAASLGIEARGDVDARAQALRESFRLSALVLTRGAEGTVLYDAGGCREGGRVGYPRQPDADSVGAGDACSAGILMGSIRGWPPERTLELANRLGAWVASVPGATPRLPAGLARSSETC